MKIYETEISKKKKTHYSLATEHNGILYISGQLSMDPETRQIPEGLKAQTRQALKNLDNVLKLANATRNDILMCRIYTPDIDFWDEIDDEYALFFGDHKPARVVVPTNKLHFGCLLEIEATAMLDRKF